MLRDRRLVISGHREEMGTFEAQIRAEYSWVEESLKVVHEIWFG
jgi:hypothetical protein